jgi:hypothetical protein
MSQRKDAILLIEKKAGLKELILRPLSAKLFEPTLAEKEGIVSREKLLDISGRSRRPQMALAKGFAISDYPCPAGGCLLTDPGFAKRIKDLLNHDALTLDNVRLLKFGRHFRLSSKTKLIIGRNEKDNEILESLAGENDIILRIRDHQGPVSILRGEYNDETIGLGAGIAAHHTKFRDKETLRVNYWKNGSSSCGTVSVRPAAREDVEKLRISLTE